MSDFSVVREILTAQRDRRLTEVDELDLAIRRLDALDDERLEAQARFRRLAGERSTLRGVS